MMNDDGKWCDIQRQIDHYYRHNNMQNNARSNLCVYVSWMCSRRLTVSAQIPQYFFVQVLFIQSVSGYYSYTKTDSLTVHLFTSRWKFGSCLFYLQRYRTVCFSARSVQGQANVMTSRRWHQLR